MDKSMEKSMDKSTNISDREAAQLAASVRREALTRLRPALVGRSDQGHPEELILDLLTVGMLWRTYGTRALTLPPFERNLLISLANLRLHGGWQMDLAESARELLAGLLRLETPARTRSIPSLAEIDLLQGWMRATGDYPVESRRLRGWRQYWASLSAEDYALQAKAMMELAAWFEQRIAHASGRMENHLKTVGIELMNRAYAEAFNLGPMKRSHRIF